MCPLKGVGYYEFGLSKVLTSKELFRPQKGLLVINVFPYFLKEVVCCGFPSPTGVTYYELVLILTVCSLVSVPNRGYLLWMEIKLLLEVIWWIMFLSPTGVTYYEWIRLVTWVTKCGTSVSVPNRGYLLWILAHNVTLKELWQLFPSPTGVTYYELSRREVIGKSKIIKSFRPQQGLPIMNP